LIRQEEPGRHGIGAGSIVNFRLRQKGYRDHEESRVIPIRSNLRSLMSCRTTAFTRKAPWGSIRLRAACALSCAILGTQSPSRRPGARDSRPPPETISIAVGRPPARLRFLRVATRSGTPALDTRWNRKPLRRFADRDTPTDSRRETAPGHRRGARVSGRRYLVLFSGQCVRRDGSAVIGLTSEQRSEILGASFAHHGHWFVQRIREVRCRSGQRCFD
jgi:hypothetical protein